MTDDLTKTLLSTTNAHVWAQEFMKLYSQQVAIDEETMIGWFANAIEMGRIAGQKSANPPTMSLDEFQRAGWLMEVNRLFFHPRGLALAVKYEHGHVTGLGPIFDARDDKEGYMFEIDSFKHDDRGKANNIETERLKHLPSRITYGCNDQGIQQITTDFEPISVSTPDDAEMATD